jgi:predicted ATPase/DNA-binding SARP family transcriptional activator
MAELELHLFGTPRLERDGRPVELNSRKAMAAMAYLALSRKRIGREELATMLWPDAAPGKSRARLRRLIYDLNKALGKGVLLASQEAVAIADLADLWVDAVTFRKAVEPFTRGTKAGLNDREQLAKAAGLATGEFMQGFSLPDSAAFDDWQFYERESLRRLLDVVLEQLVEACQQNQDYPGAVQWAQKRLALERLSEPAARQLMTMLALAGQLATALRLFENLTRSLQSEFGLEPEPETIALYESIRSRRIGPASQELEPQLVRGREATQTAIPPDNLPAYGSPFVGREAELQQVCQAFSGGDARLVTLIGPGGIGKTRLAVEAALNITQHEPVQIPGGAFFIDLAPLTSSEAVAQRITAELDLQALPGRRDAADNLIDGLRSRRLLLLLDNFEHLLDEPGNALLVKKIIAAAPGVRLLVTSRSRLNVHDEQVFELGGLDLPGTKLPSLSGLEETDLIDYSAVRFFVNCAWRLKPDFNLAGGEAPHVVRICELVDGFPLGIELAASWLGLLSPAEIAAEIERGLDFLEADWRDVPERQRSLRAVFDTSWRTLTVREKEALSWLSLFTGGFSRQAADQVCGVDLRGLLSLAGSRGCSAKVTIAFMSTSCCGSTLTSAWRQIQKP